MFTFLRSLKRQNGFTLVELMVVVAIIGLLSAVAIPNFKKYQAKAKVSEAKLQLSALFTAETAFYSDFNIYHNCLAYMGFDPGPESMNRYFAIGFDVASDIQDDAYAAAVNSGLNAADCPDANAVTAGAAGANSASNATWFPAGKGVGAAIADDVAFLPTTVALGAQDTATMTFIAGAGGVISKDYVSDQGTPATAAAALTIDENKVMAVVKNGF